jgi:hypothetical protein
MGLSCLFIWLKFLDHNRHSHLVLHLWTSDQLLKGCYLHKKQKEMKMHLAGLEPAILETKRQLTHA